jgi:hypothetical protein
LLLLTLFGCEHTVENPEWPEYKEKLVIVAKCEGRSEDSITVSCRILRTLPLTTPWTDSAAIVNDADAKITCYGREYAIPFDRNANRLQGSVSQANYRVVLPRNGAHDLTLTVRHGGKTAFSTLHLEDLPVFDSIGVVQVGQGDSILLARINPGAMARFRLQLWVSYYRSDWSGINLVGGSSNFYPKGAALSRAFWASVPLTHSLNGTAQCRLIVESSEQAYYTDAVLGSTGNGDIFGDSNGKNPPFNVTGDGIGFFWYELLGPEVEVKW